MCTYTIVLLHDVDWNPSIDRQAEDRCHRIGQTKVVKVIKLISKDTIDERILEVAEEKNVLNKELLRDGEGEEMDAGEAENENNSDKFKSIAARILENL